MKRNEHTATADATVARPIATAGEVFTNGVMIELIAGANPEHPQLMLWNGSKEIVRRSSRTTVSCMSRHRLTAAFLSK